jgi:hypothetical protein
MPVQAAPESIVSRYEALTLPLPLPVMRWMVQLSRSVAIPSAPRRVRSRQKVTALL